MKPKICRVCLVEHDEEIHEATRRLHQWFQEQVTQSFRRPEAEPVTTAAA